MLNIHLEIGRLAQDPELNYTDEGTPYVKFALADGRTKKDETQWINVIDFGESAENHAQYLSKGDIAAVMGPLDLGKWEDDNGKTRYSPTIKANQYGRVVYLGGGEGEAEVDQGQTTDQTQDSGDGDEDLPF